MPLNPKTMDLFKNRTLVIATKHQKENVISPIIEDKLGVSCFTNKEFDTDLLGTFTGEIERELDPFSTVRKKCLLAMELSNCDLGIASEGSFGSHPSMFFAPADDELVIFIDKKNELEIIARELSTKTNLNGKYVNNELELLSFAKTALFPSHGLIIRKDKDENIDIHKDIKKFKKLKSTFSVLLEKYGSVYVETDMRAMNNPSRMKVIENATKKLVEKIMFSCPSCNTPGFGIVDFVKGLPCEQCNNPTQTTKYYINGCIKCDYKDKEENPEKKFESPMFCDFCNP